MNGAAAGADVHRPCALRGALAWAIHAASAICPCRLLRDCTTAPRLAPLAIGPYYMGNYHGNCHKSEGAIIAPLQAYALSIKLACGTLLNCLCPGWTGTLQIFVEGESRSISGWSLQMHMLIQIRTHMLQGSAVGLDQEL